MDTQDTNLTAVIMAGGGGTRLWPLSTDELPKQFLELVNDRSLLQLSVDRVRGLIPPNRILVLTNERFVDMVRAQLPELSPDNVVGEPLRRDTAAAVCLGAVMARKRFRNPVIVTLTADHIIEPVELFQQTLLSASRAARQSGALYTFGIKPGYPATGYGYLETGLKVEEDAGIEHFQLAGFKEKPDLETAKGFLDSGHFLWNSGMFVWTAEVILREMGAQLPEHLRAISSAVDSEGTPHWQSRLLEAFEGLPKISIDHGVMEKASNVRCVASSFDWTDVGSWQALKAFLPRDEGGNWTRGRTLTLDATGNLVYSKDPDETAMLVGVEDLIVVRAGSNTLVVHKDRAEDVKKLVEKLQR